ncbi:MAG: hypothetical protein OEZ00_03620 [Dehalococcoidia bacterium]|nr:hypothetical protein [Dehalococcoidia bacterium]
MKQFLVFHPFLFAIFPILFLFAYNIDEVPATDLLLPISVALIGTLILLLSLRLITKNYNKIAIIVSFFLALFFSYGHVRDVIFPPAAKTVVTPNLFLLSLWALLFVVGAFFIIKSHRNFSISTKFLNIVAISLVAISLINIGIGEIKTINLGHEEIGKEGSGLHLSNIGNSPDIYYIILDMYAREDTLKEVLNYDNSEFTNYLTSRGFYVATKSCSNYTTSHRSLASSLNMDYLKPEDEGMPRLVEMMRNSKVSRLLKSVGYRYIFVDGNMGMKGMDKYAEVYLYEGAFGIKVSHFAHSLCDTTALSPFARVFSTHGANAILYAFDALADIPHIEEPTFVYAHIMCPHSPGLFDSNGLKKFKIFEPEEFYDDPEGYLGNLAFITKKVKTLMDEILSKSDVPPVIILQADHGMYGFAKGSQMWEIFNAYYLPGKDNRLLYEAITPVNSFRVVFNLYFDTDYELLKDESK